MSNSYIPIKITRIPIGRLLKQVRRCYHAPSYLMSQTSMSLAGG